MARKSCRQSTTMAVVDWHCESSSFLGNSFLYRTCRLHLKNAFFPNEELSSLKVRNHCVVVFLCNMIMHKQHRSASSSTSAGNISPASSGKASLSKACRRWGPSKLGAAFRCWGSSRSSSPSAVLSTTPSGGAKMQGVVTTWRVASPAT